MKGLPRSRLAGALAVAAFLAGGCGGPDPTSPPGPPGTREAQLRITALVAGTPIDLMVARVTAADIAVPLVFNLPVTDGVATGTLRIPPGPARTITLEAFDELGNVTHDGSITIEVQAGPNPPVNLAMLPRGGDIPITVTLAEFSVIISPAVASIAAGETEQFTAQILDADNQPLAGTVVWAVTNPAFARIDQAGLAIGVAPGTLSVVASFGGVAGLAQLAVTEGATGGIQGTVSSSLLGPLAGVSVTANAASTQTAADGSYAITGLPEGLVTVSVSNVPAGCTAPAPREISVVAEQSVTADFSVTCWEGSPVIITEIMRDPEGDGDWVELFNVSGAPVDVSGWQLHRYDVLETCVIGTATIQPGAHLVIGRVVDPAENGGVADLIQCTGSLLNASGIILMALTDVQEVAVDLVGTPSSTPFPNQSFSLSPTAHSSVANDDPASWCLGVTPYGTAGKFGTPGALNPACP